jgi:hypothetical protein
MTIREQLGYGHDARGEFEDGVGDFLHQLRPEGPWVITSIVPDDSICTRSFANRAEAQRFVVRENDAAGVYYTVNVTKRLMDSKPKKADIAEVEYLHLDADPDPTESAAQFKRRKLPELEQANPRPTFIIDSGNGLNALWRLQRPVKTDNADTVADIEARNWALAEKYGGDIEVRNIDRLLRMPSTWNYPNRKKCGEGRVKRKSKLISYNDVSYPLSAFPPKQRTTTQSTESQPAGTRPSANVIPRGIRTLLYLRDPSGYDTRSGLLMAFLMKCCKARVMQEVIIDACLDDAFAGNAIYEHCYAQNNVEYYIKRQLEHARERLGSGGAEVELDVVRVSEVEMKNVRWVWLNRLARGKLTIYAGLPGLGKTLVALDIAARITQREGHWPDTNQRTPFGSVIILSAEDAIDDTLGPRLLAAGADIRRVHVVRAVTEVDSKQRRTFNLQRDLNQLQNLIKQIGDVVLVIIDPVSSYMGERIDANTMTSVRPVLELAADMAERSNVAMLLIHHPPKAASGKAIFSFSGSLAYSAAPRLAFIAVDEKDHDGNDTERKLMLAVKNSVGEEAQGLGYFIKEAFVDRSNPRGAIRTACVEWDEHRPVTISANEALREPTQPSKIDKAKEFLREQLADHRPHDSGELIAEAEQLGIGRSTLQRARQELGIVTRRTGFQGGYDWTLPRRRRREQEHHVGND